LKAFSFFGAESRQRRNALVNLTLTDLLIVVLFVLLFFTFRSSDEDKTEISVKTVQLKQLQRERDQLHEQLQASQLQVAKLLKEVKDLNELVRRLLADTKDSLPPNPITVIKGLQGDNDVLRKEIDDLKIQVKNRDALLRALQAELAKKIETLAGTSAGGTGLPNCLVTSGFFLEIRLLPNGSLVVNPAWVTTADKEARAIDGVSDLISAGQMSLYTFQRITKHIKIWSEKQDTPCRFRVKTIRETKDLDLYLQQMRAIDQTFYPTRY